MVELKGKAEETNLGMVPALNKVPSNVATWWSPQGTMDIMPWHSGILFAI